MEVDCLDYYLVQVPILGPVEVDYPVVVLNLVAEEEMNHPVVEVGHLLAH